MEIFLSMSQDTDII